MQTVKPNEHTENDQILFQRVGGIFNGQFLKCFHF